MVNPFPAADDFERILSKTQKISIIEWITYDKKWKTLWKKEKLLRTFSAISSFVTMFSKKPSALEASESVYMRERVRDETASPPKRVCNLDQCHSTRRCYITEKATQNHKAPHTIQRYSIYIDPSHRVGTVLILFRDNC